MFLCLARIRVTVDGEFLHHIFPFQFLDSPEWDSLRPTEEGIFQVRAEEAPWLTPQSSEQMNLSFRASMHTGRTTYTKALIYIFLWDTVCLMQHSQFRTLLTDVAVTKRMGVAVAGRSLMATV